ncbi:MAG: DUF4124 domain-containing protein [Gallionellaceae bacterium]
MKFYLSVCLLLFGINAHAALNKWVDPSGQVHYSDEPAPTNANAQTVTVPSAASGVPEEKSLADQLMDLKKKQQASEEEARKESQQREKAQAKQDHCNKLRANLNTLEAGGRIVTHTEKGETVFMDDEMIQKEIKDVRKRISDECD